MAAKYGTRIKHVQNYILIYFCGLKRSVKSGEYYTKTKGDSFLKRITCAIILLPPLAHAQNLHHADEDVDKVQLERDGLVDSIFGN